MDIALRLLWSGLLMLALWAGTNWVQGRNPIGEWWERRRGTSKKKASDATAPLLLIAAWIIVVWLWVFSDTPASFLSSQAGVSSSEDSWLQLGRVWSTHTVWAALVSQALVLGGFFTVWRWRRDQVEAERAKTLSASGMAGIVDHLIDVELCLALAMQPDAEKPDIIHRDKTSLRAFRDDIAARRLPDIRIQPVKKAARTTQQDLAWRNDYVDLAVRRVVKGLSTWLALIDRSAPGTAVAGVIAEIRRDLMALRGKLSTGTDNGWVEQAGSIRYKVRLLVLFLERASNTDPADKNADPDDEGACQPFTRPEVLTDGTGVNGWEGEDDSLRIDRSELRVVPRWLELWDQAGKDIRGTKGGDPESGCVGPPLGYYEAHGKQGGLTVPEVLQIVAAVFALIGGLTLFTALFTPKRYTSKRPSRFVAGAGCLALSAFLYQSAAQDGRSDVDTGDPDGNGHVSPAQSPQGA